eukprot:6750594-Ditylum_brightwellii.AAC.1
MAMAHRIEPLASITPMAVGVSIANTMDVVSIVWKIATTSWPIKRATCDMSARKKYKTGKRNIFSTMPSTSDNDSQSNNSKVRCTSGDGSDYKGEQCHGKEQGKRSRDNFDD